jgi:paired amphipathic helix protein Sin3a
MRPVFLSTAILSAAVSSQLVLPLIRGHPGSYLEPGTRDQTPLNMDPAGPGPAIPPSDAAPVPPSGSGGDVMLSDVMGRDRSINLFAG